MAARLFASCLPACFCRTAHTSLGASHAVVLGALLVLTWVVPLRSQILLKPPEPGEVVNPMPSDEAIFEAGQDRKDLPCVVTQHKPELGFDLRFHAGYDVDLPLREVSGSGELLTVVFRVFSQANPNAPSFFVQHVRVPDVADDAKGDATLQGEVNLGEGSYHVDWLMRDRMERVCSTSWDLDASLSEKDRSINLFMGKNQIAQFQPEPFVDDTPAHPPSSVADSNLTVKLLVNFAPQDSLSAALQRSDTDALVSILKTIQRDPHVGHISLVAFNMTESRVVYRQETEDKIDFPALGKALQSVKLGTVSLQHLSAKNTETDFLQGLIQSEVASSSHPDAVIFAGPKAMLNTDVPQEELRRIGDVECPVFYMNYILNPQATPWKDSISHAIKAFRGTEYTISRPRDLWFSTSEMFGRILRSKRNRTMVSSVGGFE